MIRKTLACGMLALGALNSGAIDADNLYLMGPGTRSGWYAGEENRDKIISLDNHGDGEKTTVAFLKNVDDRSFRFQPSVDWGDTYYGPASPNETVALGQDVAVHQTNDNTWTVPFAGIFEMYVRMATNNLFMFQASKIYVVGNVNGQSWANDGSTYLSLKDGADGEYTGDMTLDQGEFKFTINPSKGWDSRYWLFRQDAGHFTTDSDGDKKWTVGDGCDLSAGRYRVNLDTKDQSVSFTRLPSEVLLDGVAFERDGDHMVATSPVFIKAGQNFYVTIDGVVRSTSVLVSGYYMLKVSPYIPGEWPVVYPVNEEPLDVYAEGLCGLDLNAAGTGYVNDHLNWRDAGQGYDFYAGGYKIGHADVTVAGWQRATVDFDGNRAVCCLESMEPRITGQGVDRGLGLPVSPNGKFTEPGVSLAKGTYTVSVGDMSQTLEIPQAGMYVVKFWVETSASGEASLKTAATGPIEVRMPLKPEDFAGGRKHYFLVGQRTSAWRLQPEWEFVPAADGTLTIPARLLYNGYVMVGMVDNYDDYVAQRYRGFTSPDTNVETVLRPGHTDGDFAFPLAELASYNTDGKYRAMRYDNVEGTSPGVQNGGYDKLPLRMIGILSSEGTIGEDTQQDRSSRVNTITLSVDGAGNPSTVRFNGVNGAPSEVIKIKTFSMVGSSIYNVDVPYNSNAVTSPLNRQDGYGGDDGSAKQWAEAWIQFDSKGDPYVDAYGEYIYHTSFTANWLRSHPTYFKDETGFEFTSNNITFFYTPDVERPDQFGQRTFELAGEQDHKEVLYTYFDMPSDANGSTNVLLGRNKASAMSFDDKITIPAAERVAFVIEDMWFSGLFKIWAGWSGASTGWEYNDANRTTYTRWYRDNGGHGAYRSNRTAFFLASTDMAYTLFEDVDAANFGIGYGLPSTPERPNEKVDEQGRIRDEFAGQPERRFYKRVKIWYDVRNGLAYQDKDHASILVFNQEPSGPAITIAKQDETHISYSYHIPLAHGMNEEADHRNYGNVTYCMIERVLLDDEGNEKERTLVHVSNPNVPRDEFVVNDRLDEKSLAGGRYRYEITTKRAGSGDQIYTAKSNIVRIDGNGSSSGVEDVAADTTPAGDNIARIFNIGGVLVRTVETDGTTVGVTRGLAPGVYIVLHNNRSTRVAVR